MKIYCLSCGSKIEFSPNNKPKFCQGCGKALGLGSNISKAKSKKETSVTEEELDEISLPNINELEIEIETHQVKGEKIESIIGTAEGQQPRPDVVRNEQTEEEFLKAFKKEAGSLRKGGSNKT